MEDKLINGDTRSLVVKADCTVAGDDDGLCHSALPPHTSTMAVGKNKRLSKKGKGQRKKLIDPFTKKEWYDVKAPSVFKVRQVGKTLCTRTAGNKIASDSLKGRVYEVSLADLQQSENEAYRKIRLTCEEVSGRSCLTNFSGMSMTRDKLCSLVRKWQSIIEANCDVKTTDGYLLRLFAIGFTMSRKLQKKKTTYAQSAQIREIRVKMVEVMTRNASECDLKELVRKFIPEIIGKEIEKAAVAIYPLRDVYIRKVKVLRSPKFDITKLMELHEAGGATEDVGKVIETPETPAAPQAPVVGDN